jgi:TRAP-type C4-dicarboxylate transport system permease small subunit
MLRSFSDRLQNASARVSRLLNRIGLFCILAMIVLTVSDVFGRYLLNQPIDGAYELTEFLLVITVAAGLAFTQVSKRHISVEFVTSQLPPRAQKWIGCFSSSICLGIYVLIAWQSVEGARVQYQHGIYSVAFGLPKWPFYIFLALGCGVLCLVFLSDLMQLVSGKEEKI